MMTKVDIKNTVFSHTAAGNALSFSTDFFPTMKLLPHIATVFCKVALALVCHFFLNTLPSGVEKHVSQQIPLYMYLELVTNSDVVLDN